MDLLHAQANDGQAAQDEDERPGQGEPERTMHSGVVLSMQSLSFSHETRSSTRSFALLARGLARTSSSEGTRGDGSISAYSARASSRNVCFTMRSSPE